MRIDLKVPSVGESISEVEIGDWKKTKGDSVRKDESIVVLESEKATVELPSPATGVLLEILKEKGQTARVGEVIARLEEAGTSEPAPASPPTSASAQSTAAVLPPKVTPAAQRILGEHGLSPDDVRPTGPGGRLLKEDVLRHLESPPAKATASQPEAPVPPPIPAAPASPNEPAEVLPPSAPKAREEKIVPMTRLRRTVAERLVEAQRHAALLTTFNEIDMAPVMALRKQFVELFLAKHGVKLGFMSFFIKATVAALRLVPQVNAEIRGKDIVYFQYCDIGVAIGGGKGLVVPVIRNAERMSFAEIELAIADFAARAKESRLTPDELQGGTFTISNGGVYGSLLSTPIVNPPQSGVLGMHAIQERPVVRDGQVVVRPMMYVALTYDHRLVDGREAVTFLKQVKDLVETPARMLLEV